MAVTHLIGSLAYFIYYFFIRDYNKVRERKRQEALLRQIEFEKNKTRYEESLFSKISQYTSTSIISHHSHHHSNINNYSNYSGRNNNCFSQSPLKHDVNRKPQYPSHNQNQNQKTKIKFKNSENNNINNSNNENKEYNKSNLNQTFSYNTDENLNNSINTYPNNSSSILMKNKNIINTSILLTKNETQTVVSDVNNITTTNNNNLYHDKVFEKNDYSNKINNNNNNKYRKSSKDIQNQNHLFSVQTNEEGFSNNTNIKNNIYIPGNDTYINVSVENAENTENTTYQSYESYDAIHKNLNFNSLKSMSRSKEEKINRKKQNKSDILNNKTVIDNIQPDLFFCNLSNLHYQDNKLSPTSIELKASPKNNTSLDYITILTSPTTPSTLINKDLQDIYDLNDPEKPNSNYSSSLSTLKQNKNKSYDLENSYSNKPFAQNNNEDNESMIPYTHQYINTTQANYENGSGSDKTIQKNISKKKHSSQNKNNGKDFFVLDIDMNKDGHENNRMSRETRKSNKHHKSHNKNSGEGHSGNHRRSYKENDNRERKGEGRRKHSHNSNSSKEKRREKNNDSYHSHDKLIKKSHRKSSSFDFSYFYYDHRNMDKSYESKKSEKYNDSNSYLSIMKVNELYMSRKKDKKRIKKMIEKNNENSTKEKIKPFDFVKKNNHEFLFWSFFFCFDINSLIIVLFGIFSVFPN